MTRGPSKGTDTPLSASAVIPAFAPEAKRQVARALAWETMCTMLLRSPGGTAVARCVVSKLRQPNGVQKHARRAFDETWHKANVHSVMVQLRKLLSLFAYKQNALQNLHVS
jgi:hypothetical protein